jgi:hypothetical protein
MMTTLAAECAVFPPLVVAFGGFSLTALFANVMVLGTVPYSMGLGCLLAAVSMVSSYAAYPLANVLHLLLAYQIGVIRFWSDLRIPISLPFGIGWIVVLYYGVLVVFAIKFSRRAVTAFPSHEY